MDTLFFKTYSSIPLLKQNVWLKFKTFAREDQLKLLIETFGNDVHDLVDATRQGIAQNSKMKVKRSLHTLKGMAATVGASRLQFIAQKAESLDPQLIRKNHLIEEIEKCGNASVKEMNNS
ncbi:Hpt domain-containing protein [Flammeovirga agarivorans]|uniref:Hpt domain-containing protein n=1 Tax=Flammeovirga agarivorans TaxID=2726742 RepID=A0A7X8SMF3_9BACT|nr:Hpt domain-containing protein [Flammeovirga agarivorans]NLR92846.1 Hpt domain-containing protein [Flammeovirga agarivorans]